MSTPGPLSDFSRAVYANDPPAGDQCAYCGRGIESEYFRVGGHIACSPCSARAQALVPPNSHKAYVRGLLFGSVTALLCFAGYSLVRLMGFMIGFVAIGVGWAIGKAIKTGSKGRGGRRYQVAALLLTYAAISMSFIPLAIKAYQQEHKVTTTASANGTPSTADGSAAATDTNASGQARQPVSPGSFALAVLMIVGLGLISPFLMFSYSIGSALFGLLFLFLGMQAAWKITEVQTVEVDGPFSVLPLR